MALRKRKAVFTADPQLLEHIEALVRAGRYRSTSAVPREAISEKLEKVRRLALADEVARYCDAGHGDEDDLIDLQAGPED